MIRLGRLSLMFLALIACSAPSAFAQVMPPEDPATFNVVHGAPGEIVDVCLNDGTASEKIATGLTYRSVLSFERPAGGYTLEAVANGTVCEQAAGNGPLPLSTMLTLLPGLNLSAVLTLTADGEGLSFLQFENDTTRLGLFGRELLVRHLAVAPPVDFRYGSIVPRARIRNLSYGTTGSVSPFGGRQRTDLTRVGGRSRVFGPQTVILGRQETTIVNIVGSIVDGSLNYAIETVNRSGAGGDGDGDGVLDVSFAPDDPTPGANTVSLAQGLAFRGFLALDVNVTDTMGINMAEFDLTFDSSLMVFLFSSPGGLLGGSADADYTVLRTQEGRISIEADRLPPDNVDAVGTENLIRLIFLVTGEGTTPVAFENMMLTDAAGATLPAIIWSGGTLTSVLQ